MAFDRIKFIEQFKAEANDHLLRLNNGLLVLEKDPKNKSVHEVLMRSAHTLKGASAMIGYQNISAVAHKIEDAFEKALEGQIILDTYKINFIFKCLDAISIMVGTSEELDSKMGKIINADQLCSQADNVFSGSPDDIEDMKVQEKLSKDIQENLLPQGQDESVRVAAQKLDALMDLSGELLIAKIRIKELIKETGIKAAALTARGLGFDANASQLSDAYENLDKISVALQHEIFKVRMVPLSSLFNAVPRAVRDLALQKGKKINLVIDGADTELDKAIIDEIKDPVIHLLRNAVDHGVETPMERIAKGKNEEGTITIKAHPVGSQVILEITDDGKGIDVEKVKRIALNRGIVKFEEAELMGKEHFFELLFTPGFSTQEQVSETSGRGYGLDIVREKLSRLKGIIDVSSHSGMGTSFLLKIPLTLAIMEVLIVEAGPETFAIPVDSIIETMRTLPEEIKSIETKDVISFRGQIMPVLRLKDIFNLQEKGILENKHISLVVVQAVERKIGIIVDKIVGRQDIVS